MTFKGRATGALSLLITAVVVVGSVVAVYRVFPNRRVPLMTRAIEAHRDTSAAYDLTAPSDETLAAWATGVLGAAAPWPRSGGAVFVMGARELDVRGRRAAHVRYEVDGLAVSVVIQRARNATSPASRRVDGGDLAVSWPSGPWTVVVVGPMRDELRWAPVLDVP